MRLHLNRLLAPVTVLGPGRRIGVWVQGCTLACRGCASEDTWDERGGLDCSIDDVADQVFGAVAKYGLTGVTLTGGEPFQQADAVVGLLARVRAATVMGNELDVLVFTGYTQAAAARISPELFASADALVAGPYRRRRPGEGSLLASSNQELVLRTELARTRFAKWQPASRSRMQIAASGGDLFLVGLPAAGDLDRLAARLSERGVRLGGVSWQA